LKDKYNSDPPETFKEITTFKGIGPKMAHLYLQCCCNKVEGIAVDVHVHRICNRLKWTNSKTPEDTMKQLEEWLPKELWVDINFVIVGFGQTVCEAKKPKCNECLIKNTCPFFNEGFNTIKNIKQKSKSKSISVKDKTKKAFIFEENTNNHDKYTSDEDYNFKNDAINGKIKNNKKTKNTKDMKENNIKENFNYSYFDNLQDFKDQNFVNDTSFFNRSKNINKLNKSFDLKNSLNKTNSNNEKSKLINIRNLDIDLNKEKTNL